MHLRWDSSSFNSNEKYRTYPYFPDTKWWLSESWVAVMIQLMQWITRSACRAWLSHMLFKTLFCFRRKWPGPIKNTDMIMKIWTYCDNNKYTSLLVWANISLKYTVVVKYTYHFVSWITYVAWYLYIISTEGSMVRKITAFKYPVEVHEHIN